MIRHFLILILFLAKVPTKTLFRKCFIAQCFLRKNKINIHRENKNRMNKKFISCEIDLNKILFR